MLGNPPWEHVELKEQEFFAARDPQIALALRAAPQARDRWPRHVRPRSVPGVRDCQASHRRFAALCFEWSISAHRARRIKTDPLFAELFRSLLAPTGRTGIIVPTGIATDATTQYFFKDLVVTKSLAALYDFENAKPIFDGVHRSFKFCLLTMAGRHANEVAASFAFFLHDPMAITASEFRLTPEEIALLNPNTGTCPIFRTRRDAEITLGIYRRVPVLIREGHPNGNPWGVSFMQDLFNVTSDSHLFLGRERSRSRWLDAARQRLCAW